MADETSSAEYKENDPDALVSELFSGKLAVHEALQRLRTRLLDLSAQNRLLSYRHPKGRSVQFVDNPNLNILFHKLIDNKAVPIKPVPEPEPLSYAGRRPEPKVHAENHYGINCSYEFDVSALDPQNVRKIPTLQTLYYPAELEKLLRKIGREAKAAIEETGSNMLFLIFGFLEFYESDDSDRPLLAPLIAMPITLNRGEIDAHHRTYQYSLAYNGEDVSENLTLREKLRQDFLLNLPELDDEDQPEMYFAKIEAAIHAKKRWRVRRQLTVGMLFFGKLAIWADLDTNKWPALLWHPLLKLIFEGGTAGDGNFFAEDYNIDEHSRADIPLVFDADSSQHSAIIDALSGKNIVINGPPGTGKSQTISNLIAIALSEGKTVLFVSEKLAALEVVRRRLDRAHLGHFCLELHSHKTQKKRLIEDIRERINQTFSSPSNLAPKLNALRNHKKELKRYAELMGSRMGNALGLTVNEVFWAADRRRQEIGDLASLLHSVNVDNAGELTYDDIKQRRTKVEVLAELYEAAGSFEKGHPWWGFTPGVFKPGDEEGIREILEAAIEQAEKLDSVASNYTAAVGDKRQPDTKQIGEANKRLEQIADPPEKLQAHLLPHFFSPPDTKGLGSEKIIKELENKITKTRASLSYSVTILEEDHTLNVDGVRVAVESASSRLLAAVLDADIAHIRAWEADLNMSLTSFTERFHAAQPLDCQINGTSVDDLNRKLAPLGATNVGDVTLTELGVLSGAVLKEHMVLLTALERVENILRKRNIPFDGSVQAIQKLANSHRLEELHLDFPLNQQEIERVRKAADFELAYLSIDELHAIYEKLQPVPRSLSAALNRIELTAQMLGLEFDGSSIATDNMAILARIAKSCPYELVEHRKPSFAWPHIPELIERAETAISLEATTRKDLEAFFYLDALPTADDLKQSIRVLRQKDGILRFLDGEWRTARKLFRGLTKKRMKLKSSEYAESLSKVVAWIELKEGFCSNRDLQDAFGNLFQGLETDCRKVRKLHDWYTEGRSELLKRPGLVNKVDLTSLDANVLSQLAAGHEQLDSDIRALSAGDQLIKSTVGVHVTSLREAKLNGWPEYIQSLEKFLKDLEDIESFLPRYVKRSISPKRTLELIEARQELSEASDSLSCLISGPSVIAKAGSDLLGVCHLAELDVMRDSLGAIRETCIDILNLVEYLSRFVGGTCAPKLAQDFMNAKLDVDLSIEKIAPWGTFFSWDVYTENARALLNEVQSLLRCFSPNVRPEKSINEALEAISLEAEAKALLKALSQDDEVLGIVGDSYAGLDTDLDAIERTHNWGRSIVNIGFPSGLQDWLLQPQGYENLTKAKHFFADMSKALGAVHENLAKLDAYGVFDWEEWQKQVRSEQGRDFPEEIELRLEIALENLGTVLPWSKYLAARAACKIDGLESFPTLVESKKIPGAFLPAAFEFAVYQSIGKSIYAAFPELC